MGSALSGLGKRRADRRVRPRGVLRPPPRAANLALVAEKARPEFCKATGRPGRQCKRWGADCGAQGEEEEGSEPDENDDAADGDDDFEASGGLQGEDGSEESLLAILSDMLEDIVEGHHNPVQQAQAPSQETPAAKSGPLPTEPAEAPEGAPAMQQPEVADGPPEVVTSLVSPEQLPAPPLLQ